MPRRRGRAIVLEPALDRAARNPRARRRRLRSWTRVGALAPRPRGRRRGKVGRARGRAARRPRGHRRRGMGHSARRGRARARMGLAREPGAGRGEADPARPGCRATIAARAGATRARRLRRRVRAPRRRHRRHVADHGAGEQLARNPVHAPLSIVRRARTTETRHMAIPVTHRRPPLRIGIGGPVGSGKTALMDALCKRLRSRYEIAAVTNDIYTREDAEFLIRSEALPAERIVGVETGGCPHTAIREDASINLAAIDDLRRRFPALDVILVESGGDNLAATFSPELADLTIYVIDVSAGEKIPRKGGPGITRSDLLVINKIDLAPYVGASLDVMDRDARKMRGVRPFLFSNLKENKGVAEVAAFIVRQGGLPAR